jgi:hypothetical protein
MSSDTSHGQSNRQAAPGAVRGRGAESSGPRIADRWIAPAVLSLAELMMIVLDGTIVNMVLPTDPQPRSRPRAHPACAEIGAS